MINWCKFSDFLAHVCPNEAQLEEITQDLICQLVIDEDDNGEDDNGDDEHYGDYYRGKGNEDDADNEDANEVNGDVVDGNDSNEAGRGSSPDVSQAVLDTLKQISNQFFPVKTGFQDRDQVEEGGVPEKNSQG